jgi:hypothetical protein
MTVQSPSIYYVAFFLLGRRRSKRADTNRARAPFLGRTLLTGCPRARTPVSETPPPLLLLLQPAFAFWRTAMSLVSVCLSVSLSRSFSSVATRGNSL